jgi:hypothetical protein
MDLTLRGGGRRRFGRASEAAMSLSTAAAFVLGSTLKDQINPKRQTAYEHSRLVSLQDADRDLPRRFLMTSVICAHWQFRSDRGWHWKLIASDLISSRSTSRWVLIFKLSLTFLAAFASGLVTGVRAKFAARVSQGGSHSAY